MISVLFLLACADDPELVDTDKVSSEIDDTDTDTDSDTSGITDTETTPPEPIECTWTGAGPLHIPDPGMGDGIGNCTDAEPNNSPEDATPCGTTGNAFGAAIYCGSSLGGADSADNFVLRTSVISDTFSQYSYWNTGGNLLDQVLYEVTEDCTNLVEVYRWDSTNAGWENGDHDQNAMVKPNTVYMLQFLNIEGIGDYGS